MAVSRFYAVGIGDRPGVYDTWLQCSVAIGNRTPPYPLPRPEWRKFETFQEAENFVDQFNIRQPDGALIPRNQHQQRLGTMTQMHQQLEMFAQNTVQMLSRLTQEYHIVKREQNSNLKESLEDALAAVSQQMQNGPAANTATMAFLQCTYSLNFNHRCCTVYTHGAFYKGGPHHESSKASVGIWFGPNSAMNISMGYINNMRRSKKDAEVLAVIIALHAAREKGILHLEIQTQSEFVVNRVSNYNCTGASSQLLTKLMRMIGGLEEVEVEHCRASERGAKEAKMLAESSFKN